MLVKIKDIKVKRRVRKDLGDLTSLKESLRRYGLLTPITLTSDYELIAGERRLEAAKALGWENINATILNRELDAVSKLEMELEENNQRMPFSDTELLDGYHRLEKLRNPSLLVRILSFIAGIFQAIGSFFSGLFGRGKASASRISEKKKTPSITEGSKNQ